MARRSKADNSEDDKDRALLARVATQDRMAFESLYAKYFSSLSRYLTRLLRRPEMIEEVVNDTMYVVWQKAGTFEGRSKVSTWITGIAYLKGIKALDRLRMVPEDGAQTLSEEFDLEDANDVIQKLGLEEWLRSGLHALSADQRSVVELTYFSGFSYQEIADVMQCPVNTIKTRMFHARRHLAKLLPVLEEHTLVDRIPDGVLPGKPDVHRSSGEGKRKSVGSRKL